ncbi:MAG: MgtC/SapB family protein [Geminicoccaceae bacterium]|nr:MgtC/SapB family protein [Geminicoccaceae bacterium]
MEAAGWLHWLGYAESGLPWAALLGRLAVAGLLGAVVGFEREFHDKPLGLRTHILVALGACGFSLLALGIVASLKESDVLRLDPTRVIQGVVGGIGFLGGGAILRGRGGIEGATTAAGIWVVGGVGLAAGFGFYDLALAVTGLAVLALLGLHRLAHRISGR